MLEKARQGELIQVRRGVYATSEQLSGNMIDINSIVPDGILCLWSAWSSRCQKKQKDNCSCFSANGDSLLHRQGPECRRITDDY